MDRQQIPGFSKLLIIAGSSRKVGKTFLATALIGHFSSEFPLIGLKISPHHHNPQPGSDPVERNPEFRLYRESHPNLKNSGRFLQAGAHRSYYLETTDSSIEDAFRYFSEHCNHEDLPVVCESASLGAHVKPDLLIFIGNTTDDLHGVKDYCRTHAGLILPPCRFSAGEVVERIEYNEGRWLFREVQSL